MVTDKVSLVKRIGEGAMGEVWVGFHETLKVEVAVKFLAGDLDHPDAKERFGVEAAAAAKIKSPHVVRTFDHGKMHDGTLYIVMELLEGETLQERLDRDGPLSVGDTFEVLRQIGKALDAAHASGIVHRDVKPHNIFLMNHQGEMFIKLLDFGSAKITGQTRTARLTLPGMLVGTPEYISRDLITDPKNINYRTDLWALGAVAYKCLTGEVPFKGQAIGEICQAIVDGRFRRPSKLRKDLTKRHDEWFARVFSHDSAARPASGAEMARTFQTSAGVERRARWAWRERLSLLALVLSVALAGTAIYLTQRPRSSSRATAEAAVSNTTAPAALTGAPSASAPAPASASPSAAPSASASVDAAVEPAPKGFIDALRSSRIEIPSGPFFMGCAADKDRDCRADERPGRNVKLATFAIDRVEVSVALYQKCAEAGACGKEQVNGYQLDGGPFTPSDKCNWGRPERFQHPMNCLTWDEAKSFCEWVEARLPTEAEWEKAARGADRRRFPWSGDFANCQLAVMGEGAAGCRASGTWSVNAKRPGASPFGLLNMAGNVREWVSDWYDAHYYGKSPSKDPTGPDKGEKRGARGGSWGNAVGRFLRTSAREGLLPNTRSIHLGFRCAADRK
ncbi:MAG TPA: bifunctional serine/threonine-protein kinase/formylglycine-generating enzyme family protein [Polyangiaceae bacterium]|jgi:formylglycine-generating enzyme required for sulfatase activity/tRNA A-37 threonylcarbamoyl transferase component Bud32|nr:bifunctional serine/threonine-protein kinase/formylglycine-generating enzyme family protein [Polyangiaceae bacterium]